MNRFEFNTDLMQWELVQMGDTSFNVVGCTIRFTNQEYLNNLIGLIKSLNQKNFKFVIVNPNLNHSESYCLECVTFLGLDLPNGTMKTAPTTNDFGIQGLIRSQMSGLGDINNILLYLMYE